MPFRLWTLSFFLLNAPAFGQSTTPPSLGQRVWIRTPTTPGHFDAGIKGTFEGLQGDSLRIQPTAGGPAVMLAADSVHQVFVFTGRRSSLGHGALVGGGVGALAGALIGFAGGEDCSGGEWLCFDRGTLAAAGAIALGGVGLVGGALVGALSPHDTWRHAGTGRVLQPIIAPGSRGVRLGLSLAF